VIVQIRTTSDKNVFHIIYDISMSLLILFNQPKVTGYLTKSKKQTNKRTCQPKICCIFHRIIVSWNLREGFYGCKDPRKLTVQLQFAFPSLFVRTCRRSSQTTRRCRHGGRCTCRKSEMTNQNDFQRFGPYLNRKLGNYISS